MFSKRLIIGAGGHGQAVGALFNATIEHYCLLDYFAYKGVGVKLAGGVKVGKLAWLQAVCCAGYFFQVLENESHLPGEILRGENS